MDKITRYLITVNTIDKPESTSFIFQSETFLSKANVCILINKKVINNGKNIGKIFKKKLSSRNWKGV